MLWLRPRSLSAMCPPCVHLESTLAAPPNFVHHVSAMCLARVRLVSALAASLNFVHHVSAGLCPPCVRLVATRPSLVGHVSTLPFAHHVSTKALALPLDFARSWPAVGQGRGIIRQNSFAPLRNPRCLYCMPAGLFPSYLHFG